MATTQLQNWHGTEERCVVGWRFGQLKCAGYGLHAAAEIAHRRDVDLHLALDLVRNGCPPETAYRILL